MIPIYEQGRGKGIGHTYDSFRQSFEQILKEKDSRPFAFIFYDFQDNEFKEILKSQGVFAELDRLTGDKMNVYYIHGSKRSVESFNRILNEKMNIADCTLPCVAFFRWKDEKFTDLAVVPLRNADLMHGLLELYKIIENYMNNHKKKRN